MSYKVITIGHQYGSGARDIAKELAKRLNYSYYDSAITAKMAEKSGFTAEFANAHSEKGSSHTNIVMFTLNNWAGGSMSASDQLFIKQKEIISDLVQKENCVIVGHCGDYLLKDNDDAFHISINSDRDERIERIQNVYQENISMDDLVDIDKRRMTYYRFYTNRKINDILNYDLVINRAHYTNEECVELLLTFINQWLKEEK
ncbi:MAG: cytidylate kinase-like family protein [Erysipelotrichaceae bacterium]|nr:cytidylate kinase-like family protein [Erysipelotrichaceae bacterium]